MSAVQRVRERLTAVGFEVSEGRPAPFGESLPLVVATAWCTKTAQLGLIAEQQPDADEDGIEPWEQLLFAVSALRHNLRGGHSAAISTPVVLAVVDEEREADLRQLVDRLAASYALFTRVDLNIVPSSRIEDDDSAALDVALAPMLPALREALNDDSTVAPADIEEFWTRLHEDIRTATSELDADDGARAEAADWLIDALGRPDAIGSEGSPPLEPVDSLELRSFRSFDGEDIDLADVSVIEGNNGSGKSSILEALEILWTGATQRMPEGENLALYTEHVGNEGKPFRVLGTLRDGDGTPRDSVSDVPGPSLRRNVLTQEARVDLASSKPAERFSAFLTTTGLEVPDLGERMEAVAQDAKSEFDRLLNGIGARPLGAVNHRASKHLDAMLKSNFLVELPPGGEAAAAAQALASVTGGAYAVPEFPAPSALESRLSALDSAIAELRSEGDDPLPDVAGPADEASGALRAEAEWLRERANPLRALVDAISRVVRFLDDDRPQAPDSHAPLPRFLAARWRAHVDAQAAAAAEFATAAETIEDQKWSELLSVYADALDKAVEGVPRKALERMTSAQTAQPAVIPTPVSSDLFPPAGFERPVEPTAEFVAAASQLLIQLSNRADRLTELAQRIEGHPARHFPAQAPHLRQAAQHCELARIMRPSHSHSAITSANTFLVRRMLSGRLFPVVRELVSALVRFEWYFEPIELDAEGAELNVTRLAVTNPELDARLLLNAAEREVVAIGWFLALHLLQPEDDRRVLVLDDPASGFDSVNRAGFVATLRSIVRLARPEQVIVTTHDRTTADVFEEELVPVDGWPESLKRIRCSRDADRFSIVSYPDLEPQDADLARERRVLGLDEPTASVTT